MSRARSSQLSHDALKCGLVHPVTRIPYPCVRQSAHTLIQCDKNTAIFEYKYGFYVPEGEEPELWFPLSEFGDVRDFKVSLQCSEWGPTPVKCPGTLRDQEPPSVFQASSALRSDKDASPPPRLVYFYSKGGPLTSLSTAPSPCPRLPPTGQEAEAATRTVNGKRVAWNGGGLRRFAHARKVLPDDDVLVYVIVHITTVLPEHIQPPPSANDAARTQAEKILARRRGERASTTPSPSTPTSMVAIIPLSTLYPSPGICSETFTIDVYADRAIRRVTAAHPAQHLVSQPDMAKEYRCGDSAQSTRHVVAVAADAHTWPLCANVDSEDPLPPPPSATNPDSPHRVVIVKIEFGDTIVPRMMDPMAMVVLVFGALLVGVYWLQEAKRRGMLPSWVTSFGEGMDAICYALGICKA